MRNSRHSPWQFVLCICALMLVPPAGRADDFATRRDSVLYYLYTNAPNLTQTGSGPHRIGRTGFWFGEGRLLWGDTANGLNFINTAIGDACAEGGNSGFSLWPGMDAWNRFGYAMDAGMITNYWNEYVGCAMYDDGATPNQIMMTATGRYLAEQMFPGAPFAAGAAYGTGDPTGKTLVSNYIHHIPFYNFLEHNSMHYLQFTLGPIRSIADFSNDAALRKQASMVFDWTLAEASSSWLNGRWCISSDRGWPQYQQDAYDTTPMVWWLMFGGPTPNTMTETFNLAQYTMPQFPGILPEVVNAATNRTSCYTRRSLAERQVGRETAYYMQTYMTPQYALWSQVEGEVAFYSDWSLKLLNLNVPTIADGYQSQRWGLAWDDVASGNSALTITTPTTYSGTTDGISIYEDTLQKDDTMLAVYNIPASGGTGGNNGDTPNQYVKGHIPGNYVAIIDESTTTGRLYLHFNQVLVALYMSTNYTWASSFYVGCSKMGLAVETAQPSEYPQTSAAERLAAFRADILAHGGVDASHIYDASPTLLYTNRHGTAFSMTYGQAGIINGSVVDYQQWPMIESPTMYQAHLGNLFIFGPNRTILYDFTNWNVLTNYFPTITSTNGVATTGTQPVDIDLTARVADTETPSAQMAFVLGSATNGTVSLLADRHTARFTPSASGNAGFNFAATDRGIDHRLVLHYDCESTAPLNGALIDSSLDWRYATVTGSASYDSSTPPAISNTSTQSVHLTGGYISRLVTPGSLSMTNGSWTFATWFRRAATNDDDFIFYVGNSDGFGGNTDELQLYCPASQNRVELRHYTAANALDTDLTSPTTVATGQWHHVAVSFDRVADNTGHVRLWLDGNLAGIASNISWALHQEVPLVFGGHSSTNSFTTRYFNGWLDDIALFRGALSSDEINWLAGMNVANFGGTPVTSFVPVTVAPGNPPPPTPAGLVAIAGNAQVSVKWNASSGATSYNVKRATVSGGPYTTIASPVTTNYTDSAVVNGITYYYVVSAANTYGESANSTQVGATPQVPAPAAPTGLTAKAGNAQVALSWTASSGATSYNVKRATTNGGPYTTIATGITSTTYTNTSLTNGTTYYYVVSAVNAGGESSNSTQVSATPQIAAPAAPTNLTATRQAQKGQIKLSWTASTGATSYNVKRATTNGGPYTTIKTGVTTTSYTDSGLTSGKTYYYVVSAVSAGGESPNSNQASATAK